nr:uncharacterized protein LOC129381221 [Dermacentor andersoni]
MEYSGQGSSEASTSHQPIAVTTSKSQRSKRGWWWKKFLPTKWRRHPRRPSHNIDVGDGLRGLLERRASLPDASQLSSITKPTKVSRSITVADSGASAKDKCASLGDGNKTLWTRLFRLRKGKKHGGHQKSGQRTASVSEAAEMTKEEGSGLSCFSQLNVVEPAKTNGTERPLQWQHRPNFSDVTIAEELPAEEEESFNLHKSLNAGTSLSLEPSISPAEFDLPCQLFGEHSAEDNDKTVIRKSGNVDCLDQGTEPGDFKETGNFLLEDQCVEEIHESSDISVMKETTRSVRDEIIVLQNERPAVMSTGGYIKQERISFNDGNTTAALLASPPSEDADSTTREHHGDKKEPETNKSEDSNGSFHDNIQCLNAVTIEPLRIQRAAQQPCINNEDPCFTLALTPLNKTPPVASPSKKCSETSMAASPTRITEEFFRKTLPKKKCTLETDVLTPVSEETACASVRDGSAHIILSMIREVKENAENSPTDMQVKSPMKAKEARMKKYSELLSCSGGLDLNESQQPAVLQPCFARAAEACIEELPDSNGQHQHQIINEKTLCFTENKVQKTASSTIVEEFAMVSDTATAIAESSTQLVSIHSAAIEGASDVNSNDLVCFSTNINKSAAAVTPSSSLGAGAGARPKSRTAQIRSKSKAYLETQLLSTHCEPRTRDAINKHHSIKRDSVKYTHKAWQQDVEKSRESLLLQFKEEEQKENFETVLQHKIAKLQSLSEENFTLLKKKETLLALLRSQDDVIRSFEANTQKLEQKEKELETHKAHMEKMEALIEDMEKRLKEEDDVVNQLAAENAVLRQDASQDPGRHEGG